MSDQEDKTGPQPGRWQLFRDVVAFQFKLAMDGLRDVLLSPVSIVAALAGLLSDRQDPGKYFYRLLKLGHRSDLWINLFGAYDSGSDHSADHLVRQAEQAVKDTYSRGGVLTKMKDGADKAIDRVHEKRGS